MRSGGGNPVAAHEYALRLKDDRARGHRLLKHFGMLSSRVTMPDPDCATEPPTRQRAFVARRAVHLGSRGVSGPRRPHAARNPIMRGYNADTVGPSHARAMITTTPEGTLDG